MTDLTRRTLSLSAMVGALIVAAPTPRSWAQGIAPPASDDDRIQRLLADWVDVKRQSLGVTIGIVSANGQRMFSHGVFGLADPRPVGPDTIFAIASLTKVFTGLLLSDAVIRGEVRLDDPVRFHMPEGVKLPARDGRELRLIDLATHTSGFPQEIPEYASIAAAIGADPNKPLFDFLSTYELPGPIGVQWSYSNMNYALIGIALAHRTGKSYEQLIHKRITKPLGMTSTGITLSPEEKARRASPQLDAKTAGVEWNKPWSLGAGSLQSTANDLVKFVSACSGLRQTSLEPAMAAMVKTTVPAPFLGGDQALGWGIDRSLADPRIFFAGRAPGFTSAMMYDPIKKIGVVALSNTSIMVEPLAREIMRPGSTAPKPADIAVLSPDPLLDPLVGKYALVADHRDVRLAAGEVVEFIRTAAGLTVLIPRYPKVGLKKLDDGAFTIDGFPARFVFARAVNGHAPKVAMTMAKQTVDAIRR